MMPFMCNAQAAVELFPSFLFAPRSSPLCLATLSFIPLLPTKGATVQSYLIQSREQRVLNGFSKTVKRR